MEMDACFVRVWLSISSLKQEELIQMEMSHK